MKIVCGGSRYLPKEAEEPLKNIILGFAELAHVQILVGDAFGADQLIYQTAISCDLSVYVYEIAPTPRAFLMKPGALYTWCVGMTYEQRDKYMIDQAEYGYFWWNGKSLGTKKNIAYAKKKHDYLVYVWEPS